MLLSEENRKKVEELVSNKHGSRKEPYTASQIASLYAKTYLDPSFQRKGGAFRGSGWTFEQCQDYLSSFFNNSAKNSIILANVKSCLRYAQECDDAASVEYFRNKKNQGYEYVSIDGNNTSSTLYAALYGIEVPNKFSKKEGKFTKEHLKCELLNEKFPSSDGIFSRLPIAVQNAIDTHGAKLSVEVLHEIGTDEMTKMFRDVNTQTSLNRQENRQGRISPVAEFVRKLAEERRDSLRNLTYTNPKDFDKLKPDQVIATFACKVHNSYSGDVQHRDLDNFYENVWNLDLKDEKKVAEVFEDLDNISKSIPKLKKKINKGVLLSLMDLLLFCRESGLKIKKHKEFFLRFQEHRLRLEEESKKVLQEEAPEKSYTYWNARLQLDTYYNKVRQAWETWVVSEKEDLIGNGLLRESRTSSQSFTEKQKQEALVAQNFEDREGNSILESYLQGELHADHVLPVSQGGETEVHNCEMMFAHDNLKKGSNINQPYFPHQKKNSKEKV